jgi:hypothetical protein
MGDRMLEIKTIPANPPIIQRSNARPRIAFLTGLTYIHNGHRLSKRRKVEARIGQAQGQAPDLTMR